MIWAPLILSWCLNALLVHIIYISLHAHLLKCSADSRRINSCMSGLEPFLRTWQSCHSSVARVHFYIPVHPCLIPCPTLHHSHSFESPDAPSICFKSPSVSTLVHLQSFTYVFICKARPTRHHVTEANTWVHLHAAHFDTPAIKPYDSSANLTLQWKENCCTLPLEVCPYALQCNGHQPILSKWCCVVSKHRATVHHSSRSTSLSNKRACLGNPNPCILNQIRPTPSMDSQLTCDVTCLHIRVPDHCHLFVRS